MVGRQTLNLVIGVRIPVPEQATLINYDAMPCNQVMISPPLKSRSAKIFRKAALYIRTYGWRVSGMSSHGKARCSMGALESAYSRDRWEPLLAVLMYDTLYDQLNGETLTEFNHRVQNGEAVAKLYERTAAVLLK